MIQWGRVYTILLILLKNPPGRKTPNFWGIKSPWLYRKNPSTGTLERRFCHRNTIFYNVGKSGGYSAESIVEM